MKYKTTITYIAAITVKKTRLTIPPFFCPGSKRHVEHRFTYVLAEVKTKKWPWSKTVTDCGVFVHNDHWATWRDTDTMERVSKSMARALTICLRCYVEGANDARKRRA